MARIEEWQEDRHSKPPAGKFTSFTPLTTLIDQVLTLIKDKGALTFLGKLKGNPNKRSKDKYCHFHYDHSHDIANCYDLKQQIETLIKQGKLKRFVNWEGANPPQEQVPQRDNKCPWLPLGDIRMIMGGIVATGSSKKA